MSKKSSFITIITLCVVSMLLLTLNITLALFGDKIDKTGIVQFKQHKLDIEIVDNDTIVLSKEELTIGTLTTRKINIKNPTNSTSCVFKIWLEFFVDGNLDSNYLMLNLDENLFTKSEAGELFYNDVLSSGGNLSNVVLTFKVNENALSKDYEGKKYNLKLCIESIQSTKIAVQNEWNNNYPVSWYEKVKSKLD